MTDKNDDTDSREKHGIVGGTDFGKTLRDALDDEEDEDDG